MAWIYLILGGLFEVVGITGMNKVVRERSLKSYAILIVGFLFSFSFLRLAMETLPMGVSYAVWSAIGAVGGTIVGMLFYGEKKDLRRLLFITGIIIAVVGLNLTAE